MRPWLRQSIQACCVGSWCARHHAKPLRQSIHQSGGGWFGGKYALGEKIEGRSLWQQLCSSPYCTRYPFNKVFPCRSILRIFGTGRGHAHGRAAALSAPRGVVRVSCYSPDRFSTFIRTCPSRTQRARCDLRARQGRVLKLSQLIGPAEQRWVGQGIKK